MYGFQISFQEHTELLTSCKMLPFDLTKITYLVINICMICVCCVFKQAHAQG